MFGDSYVATKIWKFTCDYQGFCDDIIIYQIGLCQVIIIRGGCDGTEMIVAEDYKNW